MITESETINFETLTTNGIATTFIFNDWRKATNGIINKIASDIDPVNLSAGHPSWTSSGVTTINGGGAVGGGNALTINADSTFNGCLITQTGSGPALRVEDSSTPDTSPFIVDANGNVLVGHTATLTFHNKYKNATAASGQSTPHIGAFGTSADAGAGVAIYCASADALGGVFAFTKSRGTLASRAGVSANDSLGVIDWQGYNGANNVRAASIECIATALVENTVRGTLVFSNRNDEGNMTSRISINAQGLITFGDSATVNMYGEMTVEQVACLGNGTFESLDVGSVSISGTTITGLTAIGTSSIPVAGSTITASGKLKANNLEIGSGTQMQVSAAGAITTTSTIGGTTITGSALVSTGTIAATGAITGSTTIAATGALSGASLTVGVGTITSGSITSSGFTSAVNFKTAIDSNSVPHLNIVTNQINPGEELDEVALCYTSSAGATSAFKNVKVYDGKSSAYANFDGTNRRLTVDNITASSTAVLPNGSITATNLSGAQTGTAPIFGVRAWANFDARVTNAGATGGFQANGTSADVTGTYVRGPYGNLIQIVVTGHGLIAGNLIFIDYGTAVTGDTHPFDGLYVVASVIDTNNFTVTSSNSTTSSGPVKLKRLIIRASGNISCISAAAPSPVIPPTSSHDTPANGYYVANFSVAMPNANYSILGTCSESGTFATASGNDILSGFPYNASSAAILSVSVGSAATDAVFNSFAIIG